MDEERTRWITRKATLDSWELRIDFAATPTGTYATLWAAGRCARKRGTLWTHTETVEVAPGRYSIHDLVTHLSLVCEQDRPTSNQALTRALCGAAWEQPELPW